MKTGIGFSIVFVFCGLYACGQKIPTSNLNTPPTSGVVSNVAEQPTTDSKKDYSTVCKQADDACRHLADKGDAIAEQRLAAFLLKDGTSTDLPQAVTLLRKASDQNVPEAQYLLSTLYDNGKGVPQDTGQQVKLLKASADAGYAPAKQALGFAEVSLGIEFESGTATHPRNLESAKQWYSAAIDAGYSEASGYLNKVRIRLGELKPSYYLLAGTAICLDPYVLDGIRAAGQNSFLRNRIAQEVGCAIQGQQASLKPDAVVQPLNNGTTSINAGGSIIYVLSSDVKLSYDQHQ